MWMLAVYFYEEVLMVYNELPYDILIHVCKAFLPYLPYFFLSLSHFYGYSYRLATLLALHFSFVGFGIGDPMSSIRVSYRSMSNSTSGYTTE